MTFGGNRNLIEKKIQNRDSHTGNKTKWREEEWETEREKERIMNIYGWMLHDWNIRSKCIHIVMSFLWIECKWMGPIQWADIQRFCWNELNNVAMQETPPSVCVSPIKIANLCTKSFSCKPNAIRTQFHQINVHMESELGAEIESLFYLELEYASV